jgi:hypothetical protein
VRVPTATLRGYRVAGVPSAPPPAQGPGAPGVPTQPSQGKSSLGQSSKASGLVPSSHLGSPVMLLPRHKPRPRTHDNPARVHCCWRSERSAAGPRPWGSACSRATLAGQTVSWAPLGSPGVTPSSRLGGQVKVLPRHHSRARTHGNPARVQGCWRTERSSAGPRPWSTGWPYATLAGEGVSWALPGSLWPHTVTSPR